MMKKTIILVLLCAVAALSFQRCEKLDLTADYRDITISYGILNVKDNVHYFKIYRGYLTDQNAYVEAGNWDQIYYSIDSIEVRFEEYKDGKMVRSAILDTTTAIKSPATSTIPSSCSIIRIGNWIQTRPIVW